MHRSMGLHNKTSGKGRSVASSQLSGKAAAGFDRADVRRAMAGMFELYVDAESYFRFRLTAPDGTVMAVSRAFDTKSAAVAGIADVREYAGMGHITDFCPAAVKAAPPDSYDLPVVQAHEVRRIPAADLHGRARPLRQPAIGPRWAGAV